LVVQTPRLPGPGETVLGGDLVTAQGGKGANQAVAAARLGGQVTFVARLGRDAFGDAAAAALAAEHLNLTYLGRDETAPSGVGLIVVAPDGQNQIAVAPGANLRLTPEHVAQAAPAFDGARVVLLQLENPLATVLAAALAGRERGATVILNPAPAQPLPDEIWPLVDVLTPNETEAALLAGGAEPPEAAARLLARGVGTVLVTLGAAGVIVAQPGEPVQMVPAFKVQAVDATAAGDAFNGALAVALARGDPLAGAVRFAQAAGGLATTRLGAFPSLPRPAEVEELLATAH
jgi:ribokinase